jgi:hypothetical protein
MTGSADGNICRVPLGRKVNGASPLAALAVQLRGNRNGEVAALDGIAHRLRGIGFQAAWPFHLVGAVNGLREWVVEYVTIYGEDVGTYLCSGLPRANVWGRSRSTQMLAWDSC